MKWSEVIGQDEINKAAMMVKNMQDGSQDEISKSDLINYFINK